MGIRYENQSITLVQKQTAGATCDICEAELELVFPKHVGPTKQFLDASLIVMHGWYGGFIDPIDHDHPEWILCKKCSERIFAILGPRDVS